MNEPFSDDSLFNMIAIVRGDVQGIGFRATTLHFAQQLGLAGTVRNLSNGTVEIIAQGTSKDLGKLLDLLKEKNGKRIEAFSVDFTPFQGSLNDFRIIY